MGTTHVTATVRNPAQPDKVWEGLFLVDTKSVDCLVPAKHLREIGLQPRAKRRYELADGTEKRLDITIAEIEFMGDIVGSTVIFGPDDAEPILGVTVLEYYTKSSHRGHVGSVSIGDGKRYRKGVSVPPTWVGKWKDRTRGSGIVFEAEIRCAWRSIGCWLPLHGRLKSRQQSAGSDRRRYRAHRPDVDPGGYVLVRMESARENSLR